MRAAVFDFGQVMRAPAEEWYRRLRDHGLEPAEVISELFLGENSVEDQLRGRVFTTADMIPLYEDVLLQKLHENSRDAARAIASTYTDPETMIEVPGMYDLVTELHRAGVRTGILTNGPADSERGSMASLLDLEVVNAAVISGRDRVGKPDPEAFQLIVDRLGVPATHCVFVDDKAHNVDAARRFGMAGVVFDGDSGSLRIGLRRAGLVW